MVEIKIQLEINIQLLRCDEKNICPRGVENKIICDICIGCKNLKSTEL